MHSPPEILVIYTGGTIGMHKDARTGTLAPFDFSQLQKQIPELNQLTANISTISFGKPIDSSNMNPEHWGKLAGIVKDNYNNYDGFVILHGSDTMAFTAAALSFMFENLAKPVILTGSQLPIGMLRTDGKENIITAIEIAAASENGLPIVPEVAIYFEYQLYRGNRTYKYNAEHFEAFRSPNYSILAKAGVSITYNRNYIRKASEGDFDVDFRMDTSIAILSLFPGISQHIIEAALNIKDIKVVIIRTYGSGNAMTYPWFTDALQKAADRGLILINSSQCRAGTVSQGRYETSARLAQIGVLEAGDMVIEAVIAKSMHLLGGGHSANNFGEAFNTDLRGELTVAQVHSTT